MFVCEENAKKGNKMKQNIEAIGARACLKKTEIVYFSQINMEARHKNPR